MTNLEIEIAATALAANNGKTWAKLTADERITYTELARRNARRQFVPAFISGIRFPPHIKVTKCRTRTQSHTFQRGTDFGRHGAVKYYSVGPAVPVYTGTAADGRKFRSLIGPDK